MKIDRRKNYYLMLDTETANTLDDPLVYDIGLAVVDKTGKVNGHGCYIKRDIDVLNKARKNKILNKVFECNVDDSIYDEIEKNIN